MFRLLIFGGTSEGRELAEFCAANRIYAVISVATDYGAELLPESEYTEILIGRLDNNEIIKLLSENNFKTVIDATHPYAELATENIRIACNETKTEYYRLKREENQLYGTILNNTDELIMYLNGNEKRILSTLGSKEIPHLCRINNYKERLWMRVLSAEAVSEYCTVFEADESRMFFGKGPFSVEQNMAHIRKSGAEILITKESGSAGGYPEKAEAAKRLGIELITIKRPEESGYTLSEIKEIILKEIK